MMGRMDAVRYPALGKCATPARGLLGLLMLGCQTKSPTEGKSVAEWIAQLGADNEMLQAQAGLALAKIGPEAAPAVPVLIETLKSKSTLVRQNACLALGNIGGE